MAESSEQQQQVGGGGEGGKEVLRMQDIPLERQSLELAGEPGVYHSHLIRDGQPLTYLQEGVLTLYHTFQQGKKASRDGPCLGWRNTPEDDYQWLSYGEIETRAVRLGAGLSHLGVEPGDKTNVGIYSQNSVDWVVTEQSCNYYSRVLVPLYDTLGADALVHILNQAEVQVVLCHSSKLEVLCKHARQCPTLKTIIRMGSEPVGGQDREKAEDSGLKLYSMSDVEAFGEEHKAELVLPTQDSLATICYTSGTTGKPKGVMLSHRNIIANITGLYKVVESQGPPSPEDVHISYLPLAHMMERVAHCIMFMCGGRIAFFGGDIKLLVKDIQVVRPTLFISVPRLLNRIYDKITGGVAQGSLLKKAIFNRAMKSKTKDLRRGLVHQNSIWDKLVLKKIRQLLGGRVRMIFTGSAPIAAHVLDFLRAGFGCQVFEGYGQTECTSGCTTTLPHDVTAGHVGPPLVSALIKLVDVPDMQYFTSNGEGEVERERDTNTHNVRRHQVCVKGPSVFLGYYKDEQQTREALDEDGWLHSGDIGKWNKNGTLSVIDRKKHIFKLSQGEYVAPEKVENVYCRSPLVAQVYLHGDSLQDVCVAIIVPDEEELTLWARRNGVPGEFTDLCGREEVVEAIKQDMVRCAREAGLKSFEQAKVVKVQAEQFTVENGLLTPTFKLRRLAFRRMFSESVTEMYGSLTLSSVQAARSSLSTTL